MTERIIPVDVSGPIALDLSMASGRIRIAVDPKASRPHLVLKTDDATGPSADAVRDARAVLDVRRLTVRVPSVGGGGSVTFDGGGVVVTGNLGNVSIVNGRVFSNGREITPDSGPGPSPVELELTLPTGSMAKVVTQSASVSVAGALAQLDYEGRSGSCTAEKIGELEASLSSGTLRVGEVTEKFDVTLTSGVFNMGAYSGYEGRLHMTSGSAEVRATPKSRGRFAVSVTSGFVSVTGASHLDVKRRVTSGSVSIS